MDVVVVDRLLRLTAALLWLGPALAVLVLVGVLPHVPSWLAVAAAAAVLLATWGRARFESTSLIGSLLLGHRALEQGLTPRHLSVAMTGLEFVERREPGLFTVRKRGTATGADATAELRFEGCSVSWDGTAFACRWVQIDRGRTVSLYSDKGTPAMELDRVPVSIALL